ncbi:hypothetical protein ACQ86N_42350 [Puia sp. P3]
MKKLLLRLSGLAALVLLINPLNLCAERRVQGRKRYCRHAPRQL